MQEEDTLPKLLRRNHLRWGPGVAIRDKEFGIWNEYSWSEVYGRTKRFCLGLIGLGLSPGDKVAIIGDNEPQWYWAAYATYAARGTVVGLFTDATPPEIAYIVRDSDARFVVARDQEQVDKLLTIKDELPGLEKIIWWYPRGMRGYNQPFLLSFNQVEALGVEFDRAHPGHFEERIEQGRGEDIANLYYTSGTTGAPKGAMCSHRALLGSTRATLTLTSLTQRDNILCYLPPAWIGELFFGLAPHLLTGATLNTLEEPETLMHDIREVAPALILGGPRQWEGWASIVQAKIAESGGLERGVYRVSFIVGLRVANRRLSGERQGPLLRLLHALADVLLLRPIRAYLGFTRVKLPATAGSVLSPETFRFFHGLGIGLRQVYGSTEGGMISGHRGDDIRWGTIGPPLPGVEVRVAEDGEIQVRSEYLFTGYHKDPQATASAFTPEGWWRSGDAGYLDDKGHLVFLDRMSEMGELASKERYAPQYLESGLRFSPYIKDAMVAGGPDRNYVTALITIDFVNVGRWAERNRIPYTTFMDLSQKPEVGDLIRREVARLNTTIPPGVGIRKFVCLPKEFDPDEADLTRTRKLKRTSLLRRYEDLIEAMYKDQVECSLSTPVTYQDGRQVVVTTPVAIHALDQEPGRPPA